MPQQLAQLAHCHLCLLGVEGYQGIDVVEGVEQEVRVELVAQVLELGLGAGALGFFLRLLQFLPPLAHAYCHAKAHHEDEHERHLHKAGPPRWGIESGWCCLGRGEQVSHPVPPPCHGCHCDKDGNDVVQDKALALVLEEQSRNGVGVVEVENRHVAHGGSQRAQVVAHGIAHGVALAVHEQRERDYQSPAQDVNE